MPMAWHLLAEVGNDTQNWPVFEVKVGNGHSLLVELCSRFLTKRPQSLRALGYLCANTALR